MVCVEVVEFDVMEINQWFRVCCRRDLVGISIVGVLDMSLGDFYCYLEDLCWFFGFGYGGVRFLGLEWVVVQVNMCGCYVWRI